jgi:hypothetical protein
MMAATPNAVRCSSSCFGLPSAWWHRAVFCQFDDYELRASDNRVNGLAADQAIEGAARYVSYVLQNYATNGAMPTNTQFKCEAVPVGDANSGSSAATRPRTRAPNRISAWLTKARN